MEHVKPLCPNSLKSPANCSLLFQFSVGILLEHCCPGAFFVPLSPEAARAGIRACPLPSLMYWVWQNQSTMNLFTFCQVGSNTRALEYENEGWGTFHITAENLSAASPLYQLRGFLQLRILSAGGSISALHMEPYFYFTLWVLNFINFGSHLLSLPHKPVLFWDRSCDWAAGLT